MARESAARSKQDASSKSAPKRGLRQEYQDLTRRRLLDAALEVFEKGGYNAATVEAIVARAGVARATFYLHFKNKMEMVTFLTDEFHPSVAQLYAALDDAITQKDADSRKAVEGWLREAFEWYEDPEHRIIALVWQELSVGTDNMAHGISVDQYLPKYLAQWPADLRDAARARVILLSHLLSRAYFLSRHDVLPTSEEGVIDSLADIWANGLFPPSAE